MSRHIARANSESDGWAARLELGFQMGNGRTVLTHRHYGPLAVQRPFYPEGEVCHVYVLHPPGGVVGGDRLNIQVDVANQSHALITAPGAMKFYRSAQYRAMQHQVIRVADTGCLEWFPQDNIFFPGTNVQLLTRIELNGKARLAMWDCQCFGRPTLGETFFDGVVDAHLQLWRDGVPMLIERLNVSDGRIDRASQLRNAPVSATFLMTHADQHALETVRNRMTKEADVTCGATLIDDLLIIRYLGHSTETARKQFLEIWFALRSRLIGKVPKIPRIWNT